MGRKCTYCGSDVAAHDPVYVADEPGGEPTGSFCNYACLESHIEDEGLTAGAACEWSPE